MHTGPKDYLNAEQYDEAYHSPEVVATPPMTALERQTSAETRQLASEMRNIPTADPCAATTRTLATRCGARSGCRTTRARSACLRLSKN